MAWIEWCGRVPISCAGFVWDILCKLRVFYVAHLYFLPNRRTVRGGDTHDEVLSGEIPKGLLDGSHAPTSSRALSTTSSIMMSTWRCQLVIADVLLSRFLLLVLRSEQRSTSFRTQCAATDRQEWVLDKSKDDIKRHTPIVFLCWKCS